MTINMNQTDLERLVALIKPNEWQQSPYNDNLVRADFTRNVLFIVQFSEAHTRKVLDRKTKTYREFFRSSEYIVDRIIIDPNKESILSGRSDSVFVRTDIDLTQFIQKLDLDHTLDDNAEVSFEQISKS